MDSTVVVAGSSAFVGLMTLAGVIVTAYSAAAVRKATAIANVALAVSEKSSLDLRDAAVDAREAAVLAKEVAQATAEVGQRTAKKVEEIAANVDGNLIRSTEQARELGELLGRFQANEVAKAEQTQKDALAAATLAGANAALAAQNQAVPPGFVVTPAGAPTPPTPPIPPAAPVPVEVVNTQPVPVDIVVHVDTEKQAPPDSTGAAKGEG